MLESANVSYVEHFKYWSCVAPIKIINNISVYSTVQWLAARKVNWTPSSNPGSFCANFIFGKGMNSSALNYEIDIRDDWAFLTCVTTRLGEKVLNSKPVKGRMNYVRLSLFSDNTTFDSPMVLISHDSPQHTSL